MISIRSIFSNGCENGYTGSLLQPCKRILIRINPIIDTFFIILSFLHLWFFLCSVSCQSIPKQPFYTKYTIVVSHFHNCLLQCTRETGQKSFVKFHFFIITNCIIIHNFHCSLYISNTSSIWSSLQYHHILICLVRQEHIMPKGTTTLEWLCLLNF